MGKRKGPLSRAEAEGVFRRVTRPLPKRYAKQIETGMTDAEFEAALKATLGIFGGSGGPNAPWITYQGSGLKIWASWGSHNHVTLKPIFWGTTTIKMARELYKIAEPEDRQLGLF